MSRSSSCKTQFQSKTQQHPSAQSLCTSHPFLVIEVDWATGLDSSNVKGQLETGDQRSEELAKRVKAARY